MRREGQVGAAKTESKEAEVEVEVVVHSRTATWLMLCAGTPSNQAIPYCQAQQFRLGEKKL